MMKGLLPVCFVVSLWASGFVEAVPFRPDTVQQVGRGTVEWLADQQVRIKDAYLLLDAEPLQDFVFSFEGRAPESAGVEEVGIWAVFRQFNRHHRYMVGVRGAPHDDIYLVRYAPDGEDRMLALQPIPTLQPGEWAAVKVAAAGGRIRVYLNGVEVVDVEDGKASFTEGSVGIGGGYHAAEYRNVSVRSGVMEPNTGLTESQSDPGRPEDAVLAGKAALRQQQRAAYRPQVIADIGPGRSEISLDGDWLFLPDYEFSKEDAPQAASADDGDWHVMPVPALWSPYSAWLFGETQRNLPYDKGASDSYFEYRHARVEALTFDWKRAKSAWCRKHLVLPEIADGKRVTLHFDAIAKVAYIYVNGTYAGKNYGMFGEVELDITDYLKSGSNVIAVKVDQEPNEIENGDEVVDIAISVEVTRKMLSALPFGMTRQDARGIWQPVKLVMTDAAHITDVFIKPSLEGAAVDVTLQNMGDEPVLLVPALSVVSEADGSALVRVAGEETTVNAGETKTVTIRFSDVSPRLWSPADPQLYRFHVVLRCQNEPVDSMSVVSGFRTFEARGNRLYLNGRPYALRGANHCPNLMAPNDARLADRFMRIMRENHLNATRFHAVPGTVPWMEAADRNGILISYEGTWPWLMLRGPIPPQASLDVWMDEFQRLIRKYRNHPSLVIWTVNNEMKFHVFQAHTPAAKRTPEYDADMLNRWRVVSDAVQMIRSTDPTRPVCADSCYMRNGSWVFDKTPEELGIDDGDIDDRHAYYNWYGASVFNLFDSNDRAGRPDRPYIGQEMSTGYYNGDSGHPVRAYLFAHQTPQSWVGQYAYEHRNPAVFYRRHAMLTKELAEYYRRDRRADWAGSLIFGLVTWFREPWDAEKITPYPVVTEYLRRAMSPVLVSARLTGRNLFAGESLTIPVSIVNDAEDGGDLAAGMLKWFFRVDGKIALQGSVPVPPVAYYTNQETNVPIRVPADVSAGRVDAELCFEYAVDGRLVSENRYAVRIATASWAVAPVQSLPGKIWAVAVSEASKKLFAALGLDVKEYADLAGVKLADGDCLVVEGAVDGDKLKTILRAGKGHAVWIRPRDQAKVVFPEQILDYRKQNGEVVTMVMDESPVFDGIEIGDMAWMGGPAVATVPVSSRGGYQVAWKDRALTVLAEEMRPHGYLKSPQDKLKYWVTPLVRIQEEGAAPVILSEMLLENAPNDPVALRLWANLLSGK